MVKCFDNRHELKPTSQPARQRVTDGDLNGDDDEHEKSVVSIADCQ